MEIFFTHSTPLYILGILYIYIYIYIMSRGPLAAGDPIHCGARRRHAGGPDVHVPPLLGAAGRREAYYYIMMIMMIMMIIIIIIIIIISYINMV